LNMQAGMLAFEKSVFVGLGARTIIDSAGSCRSTI
jgi:hypothetical protein